MRKLASIQKIRALAPIEGADAIETATVLGWQLVVKKGEFKVGDLCVYCEIDSILPDRPEFEFLKPRGMRIKTIRLRGQISQGICFPLSVLPEGTPITEDADVTDVLGVEKWEMPIPASLAGRVKGGFPRFMPKTDETRVQILQPLLDALQGEPCYVAEKVDGSSVTYYVRNGEFGVCSRNLELLEDEDNTLWKVARALEVEPKLRSLGGNFALQGEIIGEGVNGNKLRLRGQTARFFNLFDIDRYVYLDFAELQSTLERLDLPMVPVIDIHFSLPNDIPTLVALATRRSTISPEVWAEGIVIRPLKEQFFEGERVSFKVINPEFLLKFGE
jgi:RNA ligase (TIGR02306 family)